VIGCGSLKSLALLVVAERLNKLYIAANSADYAAYEKLHEYEEASRFLRPALRFMKWDHVGH